MCFTLFLLLEKINYLVNTWFVHIAYLMIKNQIKYLCKPSLLHFFFLLKDNIYIFCAYLVLQQNVPLGQSWLSNMCNLILWKVSIFVLCVLNFFFSSKRCVLTNFFFFFNWTVLLLADIFCYISDWIYEFHLRSSLEFGTHKLNGSFLGS